MMQEQGLAGQAAMGGSGQGIGQGQAQMVQEVARALMQGATPEQLIQQGVPAEVIQMAIEMIKAKTEAPAVPEEKAGLAGREFGGGL